MYNQLIPSTEGQVAICINRNRLKNYNGKVYLQDKQEFEIELRNGSQRTKLAKIWLNGQPISQTGLVIKPGQCVYLERFIDIAKKFLFETYTIDGSLSSKVAAALNGDVEVKFYDEVEPYVPPTPSWNYYKSQDFNQYNNRPFERSTCYFSNSAGSTQGRKMNIASTSSSKVNLDEIGQFDFAEEVETGRVEKGSHSSQNFTNYYGDFKTYPTNTISIKIMPLSQKPLEAKDLAEYCTQCGTKNRKNNYKFCPKCGTEFTN